MRNCVRKASVPRLSGIEDSPEHSDRDRRLPQRSLVVHVHQGLGSDGRRVAWLTLILNRCNRPQLRQVKVKCKI